MLRIAALLLLIAGLGAAQTTPVVATHYFYWYRWPDQHFPRVGDHHSEGHTHPVPDPESVDYGKPEWHARQLADMRAAGIDIALPVYWGFPSTRLPKGLRWTNDGIPPMVKAALAQEPGGVKIGLFYDTSTLHNRVRRTTPMASRADLTTPRGQALFCGTVVGFFEMIPEKLWGRIHGRPLVVLYSSGFAERWDEDLGRHLREAFAKRFPGETPFLVADASWGEVGQDRRTQWGAALNGPSLFPGVAQIGPGYDDRPVPGRFTPIREREHGRFYEHAWRATLAHRPELVLLETWNELHEGTEICQTLATGRRYLDLTRTWSDRLRSGAPPGPEIALKHRDPTPRADLSWGSEVAGGTPRVRMDYAQETQSGLRERPWADGPVVRREKRLVSNGKPSAGVRYVYFQIGDRWRFNRPAPGDRYELVVTTASPCRLRCEFDGFDSAAPVEGAYTSATIAGSDGRTPRTRHIFHLNGARFANRQNGGSDFRLLVAGETVAIEKVVVAPRKPRRPDIVVIMADDMGWSDIGCYGSEIKTPNLDALAKAGLRYTQFYNTSRCCPTRATLLTGLYAHQAGIGHMMSDRGHDGYRGDLNAHCVTIAEVLKPAGYGTYMSGKWHVTPHVSPDGPKHNWPRQRGFDRFFGTIHGAGSFYDPNSLTRDNTQITPDDGFYYTDAISTEAVKSIEQHAAKRADDPLFLYVTYTAPHWPLHALPEDIARYDGVYDDGWDTIRQRRWARQKKLGLIDPRWPLTDRDRGVPAWSDTKDKPWHVRRMEVYAAMVDRMDQGIGRIVDALRKSGRLNDTLILFLADNGGCAEEYGSRGPVKPDPKRPAPLRPMGKDELQRAMQPRVTRDGRTVRTGHGVMPGPADTYIAYGKGWANASNTPFRMYKHWVHEGGIAAPLIAHWPRRVHRSGQLEAQPTHLIDLMATCVDLANATYPKRRGDAEVRPMEGLSLVPTFVGDRLNNRALFWEHEGNRAVRQGRWKLVARGARGPWELYDLEANRTETTDLAKTNAERTQSMAALWHRWAERCHVLPVNPQRRESRPSFSTQRRFDLGPTADLPRNRAPYVKDRGFTITVDITKPGRSGVLVAQGGSSHGWSLHLEDGRPVFSTRHGGRLTEIKSKQPLTSNRIQVRLRRSGKITITAGDQQVARGDAGRGLVAMPADGLQVARDLKGPVGRYQTAHPFDGTVAKVVIELDMEK